MSDRMHKQRIPLEELLTDSFESMPDDARARVRMRVMAGIETDGRFARARTLFMRSAAAFAATATLMTGTGYAAATSLPGDPLYGLKRAAEEIRVVFSPDAQQGETLMELTRERAREVGRLIEEDAGGRRVEDGAGNFEEAAGRAVRSQPDSASAEQTRLQIQDEVDEQPAEVQRWVQDKVPQPAPEPAPQPDPTPDPAPDPAPTPGSGPQSPSGPGPQPQDGKSGALSPDGAPAGTSDSAGGVSAQGR